MKRARPVEPAGWIFRWNASVPWFRLWVVLFPVQAGVYFGVPIRAKLLSGDNASVAEGLAFWTDIEGWPVAALVSVPFGVGVSLLGLLRPWPRPRGCLVSVLAALATVVPPAFLLVMSLGELFVPTWLGVLVSWSLIAFGWAPTPLVAWASSRLADGGGTTRLWSPPLWAWAGLGLLCAIIVKFLIVLVEPG